MAQKGERQTHCKRGHDWSIPKNLCTYPNGERCCMECRRIRERKLHRIRTPRSTEQNKIYAITQRENNQRRRLEPIGWSIALFNETYELQNGKCALCDIPINKEYAERGAPNRACADHNHITNKARGLLCAVCNNGLGLLKDSPEILKKAVTYLEQYEKRD